MKKSATPIEQLKKKLLKKDLPENIRLIFQTKLNDIENISNLPAKKPLSKWMVFVKSKMSEYMTSEGGHAGAMKRLSKEWKELSNSKTSTPPSKTQKLTPKKITSIAKKPITKNKGNYDLSVKDTEYFKKHKSASFFKEIIKTDIFGEENLAELIKEHKKLSAKKIDLSLEEVIEKKFKRLSNNQLVSRINRRYKSDLNDDDEVYELFRRQKKYGDFKVIPEDDSYRIEPKSKPSSEKKSAKNEKPLLKPSKSKTTTKKTPQKLKVESVRNNPKYKKLLKGVSDTEIISDLKRKALKSGKRISKDGNTYYENRRNRSDEDPTKKL